MRVELQRTGLGQRHIFGSYPNSQMVSETGATDETCQSLQLLLKERKKEKEICAEGDTHLLGSF